MSVIHNLAPFGLKRPKQVRWRFPVIAKNEAPWHYIKSNDLKKKLKDYQKIASGKKITWALLTLHPEEFESWVEYYAKQMSDLNYDIFAKVERLRSCLEDGYEIFTLDLWIDQVLSGRKLITIKDDTAISRYKASVHVPHVARKVSLGALFDYIMLEELHQRSDVNNISFGRSRNQFGVTNKIGYLMHKLQIGQVVEPVADSELFDTVETNQQGYVFFYAFNEKGEMRLYSIKPKTPSEDYEMIKKIAAEGVIELEAID